MPEDPNNPQQPNAAGQPAPNGGTGGQQTTYTDAEVQSIVRQRLAAERSKLGDVAELRRKAEAYDAAQAAAQTDAEKAAEQIAQLQRENEQLKQGQLRADIAAKHGLSATQAKRLVGANEDELTADAAELAKELGITPPGQAPAPNGGRPQPVLSQVAGSTAGAATDQTATPHPMDDWMRKRG